MKIIVKPLILPLIALIGFTGCKKEEVKKTDPHIENVSVTKLSITSAKVEADISQGTEEIIQYGVAVTLNPDDAIAVGIVNTKSGNGGKLNLTTSLFYNKTSYVRIFAITADGVFFSEAKEIEFKNYHEIAYKGGELMVTTIQNDVYYNLWSNNSTFLGATDSNDGSFNTSVIAANTSTTSSPAVYCNNLNLAGFTDWYLPSINELDAMAKNYSLLGLRYNKYWSSTEVNASDVLLIDMSQPSLKQSGPKNNFAYCRCVRKK